MWVAAAEEAALQAFCSDVGVATLQFASLSPKLPITMTAQVEV